MLILPEKTGVKWPFPATEKRPEKHGKSRAPGLLVTPLKRLASYSPRRPHSHAPADPWSSSATVSGLSSSSCANYHELIRQAAQGDVVYNDDTTVKILEFMGASAAAATPPASVTTDAASNNVAAVENVVPAADVAPDAASDASELECVDQTSAAVDEGAESVKNARAARTGLFTSGVVATREGRKMVLFFSGRQHAGENLADVLQQRAQNLQPPIQMCDGLSRNYPTALKTILANCLTHARRRFVEVQDRFPDKCNQVIDFLAQVYHVDDQARQLKLTPQERLALHQRESQPVMAALQQWLESQFAERLVEPNSSLGIAIRYMLKHWDKLTLFLRQADAPLDNNLCERMLKMAIVHRKNSLFYKTQRGAQVGDIYMSLIHTCRQCGASPMDYLVQLQEHTAEVAQHPEQWMPWNYEEQLMVPVGVGELQNESVVDSLKRMRRQRRAELRRHAK